MLSRGLRARIAALKQRKNREREGLFLAEGVRVVEELLTSAIVPRFLVVSPSLEDTERGARLVERAMDRVAVHRTEEAELRRLAGTDTPQGVIAVAEMPRHDLGALGAEGGLLLVLDGVQDPGNLGTLARTADAFAARGAIALPGTVDCWNPKVVRAAAGSLFRLPVVHADADVAGAWLTRNGWRVFAADVDGVDVESVERAVRSALIVGNEGSGLSRSARALAHQTVTIRMPGRAESLNVAIAAGILMYEFTRITG